MRLIDADALRKAMFSYYPCVNEHSVKWNYCGDNLMDYEVADLIEDCIDNAPAIEAEPVRHGRWNEHIDPLPWCEDDVDVLWKCSACEAPNFATPPYCPNCGTKMDGVANGTDVC